VAPPGASAAVVQRFIGEHRRWIDDRVRDFAALPSAASALPQSVELPGVDRRFAIEYVERQSSTRARMNDAGQLVLSGAIANHHAVAKALRRWLADLAVDCLASQLRSVAVEFGFDYARVQVRRQRTRWGSCSTRGTVSLNCSLVFLPPEVVRYLFIHELAHTKHMNHSASFWRLVEKLEPEYRRLDRELLAGWRTVPAWVFKS